jgi:hypothetical protein
VDVEVPEDGGIIVAVATLVGAKDNDGPTELEIDAGETGKFTLCTLRPGVCDQFKMNLKLIDDGVPLKFSVKGKGKIQLTGSEFVTMMDDMEGMEGLEEGDLEEGSDEEGKFVQYCNFARSPIASPTPKESCQRNRQTPNPQASTTTQES